MRIKSIFMLPVLLLTLIFVNQTIFPTGSDLKKGYYSESCNQTIDSLDKSTLNENIYGSISGMVTDHDSGIKIPGVVVRISGCGKEPETTTNQQGKYSFKMLSPGEYRISFFPNHPYASDYLRQKIKVKAGKNVVFNKKIVIGGSIKGRVLKADGNPLKGIIVSVYCPVVEVNYNTTAVTKADGSYSFGNVFPSDNHHKYRVSAKLDIKGFPPKEQQDIIVEKGKQTTLNDIIFDFNDVTGIEGYVTSACDEGPLENASISISKEIDKLNNKYDPIGVLNTNKDGYFYWRNLEPGNYRINAVPPVTVKKDEVTGVPVFRRQLSRYIVEKYTIVLKNKKSRADIQLNIPAYSKIIKTKVEFRLKYGKYLDKKPNKITLFGLVVGTPSYTDIKIVNDRLKYHIDGISPGEYQFRMSFLENAKDGETEKTYIPSVWKEGENNIFIPWDYIVIIDLFLSSKKVDGSRKNGWMQRPLIDMDITKVSKNRKEKTFYYKIEAIRKVYENKL
jgi:hypothetical protein